MSGEGQPVVVGVDGSDRAVTAARWAGALATKLAAPLRVVTVVPDTEYALSRVPTSERAAVLAALQDSARAVLEKADQALRSQLADLQVATETVVQSPDESTGETLATLTRRARLFVIGCDDVGPAGALFVNSETLALAMHSSCPVVAWRGHFVEPNDRPIVVGVDEDRAAAVLPVAFELAHRFSVPLIALRAWAPRHQPGGVIIPIVMDRDQFGRAEGECLSADLAPWRQRYPDVKVTEVVEQAKPSRSLTHHAGDAQLVIVGRSHRGRVASALLGSTNLNLLHHSPVPVAICPMSTNV
jgi:nucleotide-binding universal stress UspA family protein